MRVKLEIPNFFHFETSLIIRVSDLNYGGHLGNDSFLSLAHESRIQFFKSLDMTERDFFGASLISIIDIQKINLRLPPPLNPHFNKAEFFKLSQASGFLVF